MSLVFTFHNFRRCTPLNLKERYIDIWPWTHNNNFISYSKDSLLLLLLLFFFLKPGTCCVQQHPSLQRLPTLKKSRPGPWNISAPWAWCLGRKTTKNTEGRILQGSLNATHFGGLKQYQIWWWFWGISMNYPCTVWVGNIMTPVLVVQEGFGECDRYLFAMSWVVLLCN